MQEEVAQIDGGASMHTTHIALEATICSCKTTSQRYPPIRLISYVDIIECGSHFLFILWKLARKIADFLFIG